MELKEEVEVDVDFDFDFDIRKKEKCPSPIIFLSFFSPPLEGH